LLDWLDAGFRYWALLPAVLLLILLTVYPALNLLRMSVSQVNFVAGDAVWQFTGLRNLRTMLDDWVFHTAIKNSLVFVVATVVTQMTLGMALALLASKITFGKGVYRTIMVLPILMPAVAIGSMWKLMYNYDFGILNMILRGLGFQPLAWLGSASSAMPSVIIVDPWHWVPFVFLILLAGLEALPVDVLEASSVDGATGWQKLRYVILPMMWPTFVVALMFRTIFAFKVFDEVFLLTSGGPGTATEVISLYIYKVFFAENRLGYGALLSVITLLIISIFIIIYRRVQIGAQRS
jgi:multiple sugar transport system permease protein